MPNDEIDKAKILLVKLYLELKNGKKEKTEDLTNEKVIEEKNNLLKLSLIELINYISKNINVLVEIKSNVKYEENIKKEKDSKIDDNNPENETLSQQYEELLIKAENDIRKHIKVRLIFLTYFTQIYRLNKN